MFFETRKHLPQGPMKLEKTEGKCGDGGVEGRDCKFTAVYSVRS